jgi:beta-glucosidase-like glycosyl hydrolase
MVNPSHSRIMHPKPMERNHLGQLLLVGVPAPELDVDTAKLFRRIQPGGFVLFGRNVKSAKQLRQLVDDLRDLSQEEPIVAIDQEGGRVSRLKMIGNEPPNAQQLRERGDESLIRIHGELTGELLRLFGFNLDLCPVLDISFDDEADNTLLGHRVLGSGLLCKAAHWFSRFSTQSTSREQAAATRTTAPAKGRLLRSGL